MKAKPVIIGAVAVALVAFFVYDMIKKDEHALERLSDRVNIKVDCDIKKIDGKRWGVCRYKNDAIASVWLYRKDVWVAANGNAREVVNQIMNAADTQNLPPVMTDYQSPPTMPRDLQEAE
ncbi:hypothetical protein [Pseudomonas sp. W5-01]|uniref:hypothetical protein n=1 Tax=Pseudomonas sp. W5-01 TaxID=3097454 RepID=UPI00397916C4